MSLADQWKFPHFTVQTFEVFKHRTALLQHNQLTEIKCTLDYRKHTHTVSNELAVAIQVETSDFYSKEMFWNVINSTYLTYLTPKYVTGTCRKQM